MIGIHDMNITALDLNLLKVFSALYEQRNVTRAADLIGLAQPSMSNALSRLRAVLEDELFVRTPGGMVPTPRADRLAPQIDEALALISEAIAKTRNFDPHTATGVLKISAPDNLTLMLAPMLAAHLATKAPNLNLRFFPFNKDTIFQQLDRGEVDTALSRFKDISPRFLQSDCGLDRFVVLARRTHPVFQVGLTLDRYCKADHVLVSFSSDRRGAIDEHLDTINRQRRVALVLSQFSIVPKIIAQTDYLATVPESVAISLCANENCATIPLPFEFETWTTQLVWSNRTDADPAKRFVTQAITSLLSGQHSP